MLAGIYIYPIKSCRGLSLMQSSVTNCGLQYDRRWMLVDLNHTFISQRKIPRMALIAVKMDDVQLIITVPGTSALKIPLNQPSSLRLQVNIWKDSCLATDCGENAAQWFSNYLEQNCRLVFMPDESGRMVDSKYSPTAQAVNFADGFPFLLTSEASLQELNSRLDEPLPMNRFRPNLVIKGFKVYEEDTWKKIRIGDISFRVVKPCSRCVITTIDQESGKSSREPLHTLAVYRKTDGQVFFGQNLIQENPGKIAVNDIITIIDQAAAGILNKMGSR